MVRRANTEPSSHRMSTPKAETGSADNFARNGFLTQETVLKKEAGRPYDWEKEWRWRIVNPTRQHYSSGKDIGYVVACRDVEDEQGSKMWPAGKFMSKTRESPADAIDSWVKGEQNIENEDILVYLTIDGVFSIGTTHIPCLEDWPVMPVEHLSITLEPQSFFTMNPSMDISGTRDPKSVAAFSQDSSNNEAQSNCHCD
ncbi:copper amine oxidase [Armillaria mellea]|nr:copper amine oxidase [Armillaria mellea]